MKRTALVVFALVAIAVASIRAQDTARLFRAGVNLETVDGDLKGAIEQYKKVAAGKDRPLAAQAQLRIAECYRKLGDHRAQETFEAVLSKFGDQKDVAAEARLRLSALNMAALAGQETPAQGIYVVHIDPKTSLPRGAATSLTGATGDRICAAAWSPDGKSIAFKRRRQGPVQAGRSPFDLVVRSVDSSEEKTFPIDTGDPGCWSAPVWFPDSKSLAMKSFMERNAPSNFRVVTATGEVTPLAVPEYKSAIVAGGGQVLYGTLHQVASKSTSLVRIGVPNGEQTPFWVSPFSFEDILVPLRLALSPNGRTLALVIKAGLDSRLITVGADGKTVRELYSFPYDYQGTGLSRSGLAWTSDGRAVLFLDSDRTGQRVMRISAEGGLPEFTGMIMRSSADIMFDVSPDGARIAFSPGAPLIVPASAGR